MSYIFYPVPTPVFPALPSIGWSVKKKPILASRVTIGATGRETQLACAAFPRWAFTLTYTWLREQTQNTVPDYTQLGFREFEQISGLFLLCKGSYGEFYFEDPDDNSRLDQMIGLGDGNRMSFPVIVNWGSGPFAPPMFMPVGGVNTIEAVYLNGIAQDPSTYSMDDTNTNIVFTSAPGANVAINMDLHFYFRCRFLEDHLDFSQILLNRWEAKEVKFESVKP
jgi:uncharacterized protein (TIGR02217 family)